MNLKPESDKTASRWWARLRSTSRFRSTLTFLIFVAIATAFWLIVSLNDSVQDSFNVDVEIYNVPDSVTFITEPPKSIHVTVRDKGTLLLRNGVLHTPELEINFKEFANQGRFRFTSTDLYSALRARFGNTAQFSSVSLDSICLNYTEGAGKKVPIVIVADVSAAAGKIIASLPEPSQKYALLYAPHEILDTITHVYTRKVVRRNLDQTTVAETSLAPIQGVRIIPDAIRLTIPVEALVNKRSVVNITPTNVPEGRHVLLFPARIQVDYFLPMSKFDEEKPDIVIEADFSGQQPGAKRVPLKVGHHGNVYANISLLTDSVEYTLIK